VAGVAVGSGWIVTWGMTTGDGVRSCEKSNGVGVGKGVMVGATIPPPPPPGSGTKGVVGVAVGGTLLVQAKV
jgi:hypothetical protein